MCVSFNISLMLTSCYCKVALCAILHWHVALLVHICVSLCRYDSYGRLTNVTYPTGQVSSYRTDADSSVRIQTEGSNKENITVTTNLSASGTFYTLMQGGTLLLSLISGTYDIKVQCQKALLAKKKKIQLVWSVRQVTPGQPDAVLRYLVCDDPPQWTHILIFWKNLLKVQC